MKNMFKTAILGVLLSTLSTLALAQEAYWSAYNRWQGQLAIATYGTSSDPENAALQALVGWAGAKYCESIAYDYNNPSNGNISGPAILRGKNYTVYSYPVLAKKCTGYYYGQSTLSVMDLKFNVDKSVSKTVCDPGYKAILSSNNAADCISATASLSSASLPTSGAPLLPTIESDCGICSSLGAKGVVGDPINLATGNVFEQEIDYQKNGRHGLVVYRTYNSLPAVGSDLLIGQNWRLNWDRKVYLIGTTRAAGTQADGSFKLFMLTGTAPDMQTLNNLIDAEPGSALQVVS